MKCRRFHTVSIFIILMIFTFTLYTVSSAFAAETATVNVKVVLRQSASQTSQALQTLPAGEEVTVLDTADAWYRVRYGNFTGYIMQKYVDLSGASVIANQDAIDALGDVPGPLNAGDEGADVKLLQKALTILGCYSLKADGIYGNGTTTAVALFQQANNLEPDGIAGKYTIRAIFGSCDSKTNITVSGLSSEDEDEYEEAVSTSGKNTVSSYAEIGKIPEACKEGDSGSNVMKVQQALYLLGYYNGEIDGDYGAKTTAAVMHFQKNRGMKQDGIAGSATIRVMFSGTGNTSDSSSSSTSKTYKTIVLDWYEDNVSAVIPKHAKFTVKDVKTGKTFQAVRWSGVNHLDAEPATAEDAATMKSIYGGSWSWNRRPILILYKNKVYAASMNGMPHGTTTIDNNNFDGHFCIHFKNSKTHGTNVVDAAHQAAVDKASKAVW